MGSCMIMISKMISRICILLDLGTDDTDEYHSLH